MAKKSRGFNVMSNKSTLCLIEDRSHVLFCCAFLNCCQHTTLNHSNAVSFIHSFVHVKGEEVIYRSYTFLLQTEKKRRSENLGYITSLHFNSSYLRHSIRLLSDKRSIV